MSRVSWGFGGNVFEAGHPPDSRTHIAARLGETLEDDMAITKTELVASIASATGQSQATVSGVLDGFFNAVAEAVSRDEKVTIPGWISFEQVATSARTGRNPQTGATIEIPAGRRTKVTAGSKLKAAAK